MLRVLLAAVTGGMVIRLWSLISPVLLPWPSEFVAPAATVLKPAGIASIQPTPEAIVKASVEATPLTAGRVASEADRPVVPFRGYYRPLYEYKSELSPLKQIGVDISVALVMAIASLAGPRNASWPRYFGVVLLTGLFAVLICNISQANRLDWDLDYLLVLCADHFVTVLLAAMIVTVIIHTNWPKPWVRSRGHSRTS